ncbi:glycosyltransferase [Marixanthomonas ophiurae]|uniref:Glycosyltransferase n=1 Tax=Marixanthomonas ophiurae TaxID=387659 RepID=A0A3E1QD31_9FLAO|nr:glycosyltransferase [Marixanthomonas ophiurae]RFN60059.1 glycosyltransferase [Marixanthomonas ophiurae]
MKLAIISHTAHYKKPDGTIVGWGPTVTEINHLANQFEVIYHVAVLHPGIPPESALSYTTDRVTFIPLKPTGGSTLFSKVDVLLNMPSTITTVSKILKKTDIFQVRTPMGIAMYLIPWITLFSNKKGWYKYAGNWVQKKPSLSYAFQRWVLKKQSRRVTVNGQWEEDPAHVIPFENPCLTKIDRELGKQIVGNKVLETKKAYCFVGGLQAHKGIDMLFEALQNNRTNGIKEIHIVGSGILEQSLKSVAEKSAIPIIFHGSLPREQVFEVYKLAHFILLPSKNEGFPKVVSEAMNFGCIPIVSDVSCINQYIEDWENGFLIEPLSVTGINKSIDKSLAVSKQEFTKIIDYNYNLAERFTYSHYIKKIASEILDNQSK